MNKAITIALEVIFLITIFGAFYVSMWVFY